jgi:hypothetical protein
MDALQVQPPKAPSENYGNTVDLSARENEGLQGLSASETVHLFMDGA